MNIFFTLLMIGLFLLLIAFVFSISLLTPLVGKNNIFVVVIIGFIVGIVGGAFFISPVYDDIPDMARDVLYSFGTNEEVIHCNVSTRVNVSSFMDNISKVDGVKEIYTRGIVVKTDPFDDNRAKIIKDRLPYIDGNITSWKVDKKGEIILETKRDYDPQEAINVLGEWLMYTGEINLKYSIFQVHMTVLSSDITNVTNALSENEVVITSIDGPVEDTVSTIEKTLPDNSNIILVCGFIGVLVGVIGFFIDKILFLFKRFRRKIKSNIKKK